MAGSMACSTCWTGVARGWPGSSGGWTAVLLPAFSVVRQGAIGGGAGSQLESNCGLMPCSTCWTGVARGWPVEGERASCKLVWQLMFGTMGGVLPERLLRVFWLLPTSKSVDRFFGVSHITPSVPGSGRSEGRTRLARIMLSITVSEVSLRSKNWRGGLDITSSSLALSESILVLTWYTLIWACEGILKSFLSFSGLAGVKKCILFSSS